MPVSDIELPEIATIYGRYAALTDLSAELGGWLLLYAGLDPDGVAVAMAANVAGAASLGMEPDRDRAKAALRAGVCDFVVNNLGEALRILKNEIRQRRTVSVVLEGAVDATVAEMVERGAQPEVLAFPVPELVARGARVLAVDVEDGLIPVEWSVEREAARSLPGLDGLAVAALGKRDGRARWIEASPRYLGRAFARRRFLRMTTSEVDAFATALREAVKSGEIPAGVRVTCGEVVVIGA